MIGNNSVLVDMISVVLDTLLNFHSEGYFMAYVLLGTLSTAGMIISPPIGIGITAVGLGIFSWWNLIPIGWVGLTGIIGALLLIAFAIRRGV